MFKTATATKKHDESDYSNVEKIYNYQRNASPSQNQDRINELNRVLQGLSTNVKDDKNRRDLYFQKIKLLEERIQKSEINDNQKFRLLYEQYEKLEETLLNERDQRQVFNNISQLICEKSLKSLTLIEKNFSLSLNEEYSSRKVNEQEIFAEIDDKIQAMKGELKKDNVQRNEYEEKQIETIEKELEELRYYFEQEKQIRDQNAEKLIRGFGEEILRLQEQLSEEKRISEESYETTIRLLQDLDQSIQNDLENKFSEKNKKNHYLSFWNRLVKKLNSLYQLEQFQLQKQMGNQVNYKAKFVNVLSSDEESQQANEIQQILMTDFSQEDYLNSFYPSDIRDVLKQSPSRITRIINYIHNFLCDSKSELVVHQQYRQWKNCLRILTSIIPVLYEDQFKETMRNIFWYPKVPEPNEEQSDRDPPLIISLLKQLVKMCFIFGFTIDTMEKPDSIINNDTLLQYFKEYYHKGWNSYDLKVDLIWKGFNTQCKYPNDIAKYYENRYLVLSCILALVSQTLFQTELFYEVEDHINLNNDQEKKADQIKVEKQANDKQHDEEGEEGEIEEEKQFQQQQQQKNQLNNHNQEGKMNSSIRFLAQTPNAALLAIQKMPYFPELFASMIGVSLFPTERIKQFLKNLSNVRSQNEENLISVSLQLIELIIGGQGLVYKDGSHEGETQNLEMNLAIKHFACYNCPFPQLIHLPLQIQQNIICQLTSKFFSYFKSQQQFIRGYFEKQISEFESHFLLLCYLLLKTQEIVPNLMIVFLLSYFNEKQAIKKLTLIMLRQLSTQPLLNKQLCLTQEFSLSFTNSPLIIGTWGDLLIFTLCQEAMLKLPNIKPKQLSNISIIIFNVSHEIGPLNQNSSIMICKLIRLLSNYDTVLKSPQMLMNVMNLINAISMMLYCNPESNIELLTQVLLIADSIKFINNLTITKGKLSVWWNKHVAQNPIVNQSFVKSKQFDDDVHEIRESEVRSVTQNQQPNILKKQQQEIQSLQQIEQVQSERTQKVQAEYILYLKSWQQFNFEKLNNFKSLNLLIENLMKLIQDPKDSKRLHSVLQIHDLKSLMLKQSPVKIFADKFEGYKKITKSIWGNCLMKSGKFPYFEKSECPCFIK